MKNNKINLFVVLLCSPLMASEVDELMDGSRTPASEFYRPAAQRALRRPVARRLAADLAPMGPAPAAPVREVVASPRHMPGNIALTPADHDSPYRDFPLGGDRTPEYGSPQVYFGHIGFTRGSESGYGADCSSTETSTSFRFPTSHRGLLIYIASRMGGPVTDAMRRMTVSELRDWAGRL